MKGLLDFIRIATQPTQSLIKLSSKSRQVPLSRNTGRFPYDPTSSNLAEGRRSEASKKLQAEQDAARKRGAKLISAEKARAAQRKKLREGW